MIFEIGAVQNVVVWERVKPSVLFCNHRSRSKCYKGHQKMKIIITEAASQLAYHLVPVLASGNIIENQKLDIVLVDNKDKLDDVCDLVAEIEDCVYEAVSSVETSCDLCDLFKTADVALILPRPREEGTPKDVHVDFTELKQIDFHVLDGVFHPAGILKQDSFEFKTKGLLSTVTSICRHLHEYHQACSQAEHKTTCTEPVACHEEAELGMVDSTLYGEDISPWLGSVTHEKNILLMLITSENFEPTDYTIELDSLSYSNDKCCLSKL